LKLKTTGKRFFEFQSAFKSASGKCFSNAHSVGTKAATAPKGLVIGIENWPLTIFRFEAPELIAPAFATTRDARSARLRGWHNNDAGGTAVLFQSSGETRLEADGSPAPKL